VAILLGETRFMDSPFRPICMEATGVIEKESNFSGQKWKYATFMIYYSPDKSISLKTSLVLLDLGHAIQSDQVFLYPTSQNVLPHSSAIKCMKRL